jgi:hypothetical protein
LLVGTTNATGMTQASECFRGWLVLKHLLCCSIAVKTYSGRLSIKNLQYRAIYNDTQSKEYIELRNTLKNAVSI